MTDEITELKTQLAALKARLEKSEARVGALEARGNGGLGTCTEAEADAGKGKCGTGQQAMDRASVPRHITEGMVENVGDAMVREIVRTAKAPR
jgi:hypothetical protein